MDPRPLHKISASIDVPNGLRVLFLEDDILVNMSTTQVLKEFGCIVHSYMRIEQCFEAIERQQFDIAVLDVNISGRPCYALADELARREVPLLFMTGYDTPDVNGRWAKHHSCRKPCVPTQLFATMARALADAKTSQPRQPRAASAGRT